MEFTRAIMREMVKQRQGMVLAVCAVVGLIGCSAHGTTTGIGAEAKQGVPSKQGVAKGEASQQVGQQGLNIDAGGSSPILAGPEIIIGSIKKIQGEEYTIEGDRGQDVRIRVTTDTNKVCPSSDQAKVSSGQEGARERAEVSDRQDLQQHAGAPASQDPSKGKATVGSTDQRANEDVARGSGFMIGQCAFKEGDHVRVEASDMGTATTIKQLLSLRSGE